MSEKLKAWLCSAVGQWAQNYVDYGFSIFPCHGTKPDGSCTCAGQECKNIGKHPYTAHGLKDASSKIEIIAALFSYRTDLNIALATGARSGVFVVDIDNRGEQENGEETLRDMVEENGALPTTLTSITGSGRHLFFKMPDFDVRNKGGFAKKIDIRGTGGYVIVCPSVHYSGAVYTFDESTFEHGVSHAPAWLLEMLKTKPKTVMPLADNYTSGATPEWSKGEVYNMLDCISSDIGYDEWLHVGMALHAGGYPLSFWDDWSRGSQKYQNGDCEKRWKGFNGSNGITMGTLVEMAQMQGWKPAITERPAIDTSTVDGFVQKARDSARKPSTMLRRAPSDDCKFNFDPMKLEGLIGDTVRAIVKYAMQPQPELALLNVLCAAGAVFGRRYCSPMNTRTNLYMIGIARTAGGKDHSRQYIANVFEKAGLMEYMGANYIRSDTGMLVNLMERPSQLLMVDEFGMYMEALCNPKAPAHIRNVSAVLTKLYSSSGSYYDHSNTADTKTRILIQRPNICLYGTTTEENYIKSLRRESIASGELNRFLVFKSDHCFTGDEIEPPTRDIPEDLIDAWERHVPIGLGGIANLASAPPEPVTVEWDDECLLLQRYCYKKQQDILNSGAPMKLLWGRYRESIIKIAMIFAIADNKQAPVFTPQHFCIATNIVDTCLGYMANLAVDHMAENDYEANQQRILNYLRGKPDGASMSELNNRFRSIKSKERRDMLIDMINQELVYIERVGDSGKPREIVRVVG